MKGKYFVFMDKYIEVKFETIGIQSRFKQWFMKFFFGLEWVEVK